MSISDGWVGWGEELICSGGDVCCWELLGCLGNTISSPLGPAHLQRCAGGLGNDGIIRGLGCGFIVSAIASNNIYAGSPIQIPRRSRRANNEEVGVVWNRLDCCFRALKWKVDRIKFGNYHALLAHRSPFTPSLPSFPPQPQSTPIKCPSLPIHLRIG